MPTYRLTAKALITNDKGQFLLCKEDDGYWCIPGGGIEEGETGPQALARELEEEMGIAPTHIDTNPTFFFTEQAIKYDFILGNVVYKVELPHFNFIVSNECEDIGWFSLETLDGIQTFEGVYELAKLYKDLLT